MIAFRRQIEGGHDDASKRRRRGRRQTLGRMRKMEAAYAMHDKQSIAEGPDARHCQRFRHLRARRAELRPPCGMSAEKADAGGDGELI